MPAVQLLFQVLDKQYYQSQIVYNQFADRPEQITVNNFDQIVYRVIFVVYGYSIDQTVFNKDISVATIDSVDIAQAEQLCSLPGLVCSNID